MKSQNRLQCSKDGNMMVRLIDSLINYIQYDSRVFNVVVFVGRCVGVSVSGMA